MNIREAKQQIKNAMVASVGHESRFGRDLRIRRGILGQEPL